MAEERPEPKRHFILNNTAQSELFSPVVGRGGDNGIPRQNRQTHGQKLLHQLHGLVPSIEQARAQQEEMGLRDGFGLQIEFESLPDIELAFESLTAEGSGIELQNVRYSDGKTFATVFMPDGKLHILENKIAEYLNKDTKSGAPRNQALVDAIRSVRVASVQALWTDDPVVFPTDAEEAFWWEVWLPVRRNRMGAVDHFKQLAEGLGFRIASGEIEFPERTVLLVFGSLELMQSSVMTLNNIAELRRAKETADFFDSLPPEEQPEWADELLQRMTVPGEIDNVPYVCLLDTGVNRGHPLLSPSISQYDTHTVEPGWGLNDNAGHGTEMAGLAVLGDLTTALDSAAPVEISHRLESVKLLDQDGANGGDPAHHGYLTMQAVSRPEITAPERKRVFGMAITAEDARDKGQPSAWSATIDRLAVDYENQGEMHRLFVISAGNIDDIESWADYPDSNSSDAIHDPGQAWNALTVGASTELVHITEPDTDGYQPIAPVGGLSPFSTTSQEWDPHWPLKPDVVFEGGNVAKDAISAAWMHSLSLLTTSSRVNERLFTTSRATSAASALASRMVARLMAEYPELRVETIRALMVHSAEWTSTMKRQFLSNPEKPSKGDVAQLVRHCGFGQPDLSTALWSVENSLTLICEDRLQPFQREDTASPKLRDMNLHRLPWPLEELEALGEAEVEMRVTLSYFIEPNPSSRGVKSRYRYESHGLRFDVKRAHESDDEFRYRINKIVRDTEEGSRASSGSDSSWLLGTDNRHRGSLHSDIWKGTAADLASRGILAVYPVSGWWKLRQKLERYNQQADYSLLVSIRAPEIDVELYSAIENQVTTAVEV
ncbi:MAG: S8 family peptidase [Gammaproteobacteria bacterium]|nr:S8 family peptidase [Gammaproteobacteria bacterium]MBT3490554.1 S8 family peptidase [Gammaproteobacteria bacterium]MBT3719947.1 S8 family peptidase [Gammaproteobacteria bacterium]MBT3844284.1 S8 family peptidase [Gammaproteobacteria bacterium]MBT3892564.1 S8 family peptidase [Gammaproteobacteria bacterium]